jgi:deoxyhypusine synthase
MSDCKKDLLSGPKLDPQPLGGRESVVDLVDNALLAYNGARLREAAKLLSGKMLAPDVTVGLSLSGAMTPAGLGISAIIPLIQAGFVDWIVSTGANLYHDLHFALGFPLHQGSPFADDVQLREEQIIRIYDIFLDFDVLLKTDAFLREVSSQQEFQCTMTTAEYHYRLGRYVLEREKVLGVHGRSLLSVAYECGVPIYTSSPGDSTLGMNVAERALSGGELAFDVSGDVNETAAIVLDAKRSGGKSGVFIVGGGSPKNFVLQTEPQIQEVLGIPNDGHDYFLQITDARPDTGGLSGATPSEAVSWGKVDPKRLPDSVVCYVDSTIGLPILTSYALGVAEKRPLKRLYDQREESLARLVRDFKEVGNFEQSNPPNSD